MFAYPFNTILKCLENMEITTVSIFQKQDWLEVIAKNGQITEKYDIPKLGHLLQLLLILEKSCLERTAILLT